jgi:hypothetical protein
VKRKLRSTCGVGRWVVVGGGGWRVEGGEWCELEKYVFRKRKLRSTCVVGRWVVVGEEGEGWVRGFEGGEV